MSDVLVPNYNDGVLNLIYGQDPSLTVGNVAQNTLDTGTVYNPSPVQSNPIADFFGGAISYAGSLANVFVQRASDNLTATTRDANGNVIAQNKTLNLPSIPTTVNVDPGTLMWGAVAVVGVIVALKYIKAK
jgi:hypothetical protein